MHTVYHTPDGQVLGITATPDPEFEFAHRLAGTKVQTFQTDELDAGEDARTLENVTRACQRGRVVGGKIVIGQAAAGGAVGPVDIAAEVSQALEKLAAEGKIQFVTAASPTANRTKKQRKS